MTNERKDRLINLLGENWFDEIGNQFELHYMIKLNKFLSKRYNIKDIYPDIEDVFKVFRLTPYRDVKIVILGQDPYNSKGVADGLAFSCKKELYVPLSLNNIFKEIERTVYNEIKLEQDTDLSRWSKQGVFLFNTILTVERGIPLSHANIGWEQFSEYVIQRLNNHPNRLVFLLWGSHTIKYEKFISKDYHKIIKCSHTASATYSNGDWDCKDCFNQANEFIKGDKIIW